MKIMWMLGVVGIVAAGFWWSSTEVQVVDQVTESTTVNPMRGAKARLEKQLAIQPDFSELDQPFSMDSEGTEIAGQLRTDVNGNLIVDTELKAFFDYFFSSVGQVTPEQAMRRIHLLIAKNLPESAAQQALELLSSYLEIKEASIDLLSRPIDQDKVQNSAQYRFDQLEFALNTLKSVRREYMSEADAYAFFQDEEAYGDYTLASQKIALNTQLTEQEKRELKVLAQQNLPEEMREIVATQESRSMALQDFQTLLSKEPSMEEIAEYAYEHFDPQEASNLIAHYEKEFSLKQQYAQYREDVQQLTEQSLSEEETEWAKEQLLAQHFEEQDRTVIQAWDLALVP